MCVLFLFFLVTILTLIKEVKWPKYASKWLERQSWRTLIPRWSFFAPIPCMHDYYLLYRCLLENEKVSDWCVAYQVKERVFLSCIWNPSRKQSKAYLDMILDLLHVCTHLEDKNKICISIPYLHLLSQVDAFCSEPEMQKVQFAILKGSRITELSLAFTSELHPITKRINSHG